MSFQHKKNQRRIYSELRRIPRRIRRRNYKEMLAATYWRRKATVGNPKRKNYRAILEWINGGIQ